MAVPIKHKIIAMKPLFIVGIIVLIIVAVLIGIILKSGPQELISIDKKEYSRGDAVRVNIRNNFKESICFSSCYPYYLEQKEEEWKSYPYSQCATSNIVADCFGPDYQYQLQPESQKGIKRFELELPLSLNTGKHRIVVPLCIGCTPEEPFRTDDLLYSDEFIIK